MRLFLHDHRGNVASWSTYHSGLPTTARMNGTGVSNNYSTHSREPKPTFPIKLIIDFNIGYVCCKHESGDNSTSTPCSESRADFALPDPHGRGNSHRPPVCIPKVIGPHVRNQIELGGPVFDDQMAWIVLGDPDRPLCSVAVPCRGIHDHGRVIKVLCIILALVNREPRRDERSGGDVDHAGRCGNQGHKNAREPPHLCSTPRLDINRLEISSLSRPRLVGALRLLCGSGLFGNTTREGSRAEQQGAVPFRRSRPEGRPRSLQPRGVRCVLKSLGDPCSHSNGAVAISPSAHRFSRSRRPLRQVAPKVERSRR